LNGTVRRIYGLGPTRRAEVELKGEGAMNVVEINAPVSLSIGPGQLVNLRPTAHRLFEAEDAKQSLG
jgi:hypothetical protein